MTRLVFATFIAVTLMGCARSGPSTPRRPEPSLATTHAQPAPSAQAAELPLLAPETEPVVAVSADSTTASGSPLAPPTQTEPNILLSMEPLTRAGERTRPAGAVASAVADEERQTWNYGGRGDPSYISNREGYHPGTRVIVDATPRWSSRALRSKSGKLVARRLVAGLRNRGYWPFRNCFEDATRQHPDPGGKTHLRVTLTAAGRVTGARLIKSTLKNKTVGPCIARVIRGVHTDRPLGRRLDADVIVSTWPGDLPLLPLPQSAGGPSGSLEKLDAALRGRLPDFFACFADGRRADAELWGRLSLSFAVDEQGHPTQLQEVESHFGSDAVIDCVMKKLSGAVLPQSKLDAKVQLAFRLAPAERGAETLSNTDSAAEDAQKEPDSADVSTLPEDPVDKDPTVPATPK